MKGSVMVTKKKKSSGNRTIYDQNYYKAQAMILDPWFIEKIAWLKNRFVEVGCPLPKRPFKKYKDYLAWNKRFWDRYAQMMKSPEYLQEKNRITGGKENIPLKEYEQLQEFEEQFLPPVYGNIYDKILEHFRINHRDKGFRDFLEYHIFFGYNEYPTSPFSITWRRNDKTRQPELFIRLYGHTKKEDIISHWDQIAQEQKHLSGYMGKNKEWQSFERDIEIYNQYKSLKDPKIKRNSSYKAIDIRLWATLRKKYPNLTVNSIRSIITKTRKRLGEI
jgi:hypothetical protein